MLIDLDPDRLVQIALDTLINEYVADPGMAHQPRRMAGGGRDQEDDASSFDR